MSIVKRRNFIRMIFIKFNSFVERDNMKLHHNISEVAEYGFPSTDSVLICTFRVLCSLCTKFPEINLRVA